MNKNKIIIIFIIILMCVCLFVKIYNTNSKYGMPEEKWYGIGENVEYEGLQYTLKDIEVCDIKDLSERFKLDIKENSYEKKGDGEDVAKKYFLVTLDIKALDENYKFDLSQIGQYSKNESSYSAEYLIMFDINKKRPEINRLEKNESIEYYMVLSFSAYYYTPEGLAALSENDVALVIYDYYDECINYMCKGGRLDTNYN